MVNTAPKTPQTTPGTLIGPEEFAEQVRRRAYEIYEASGRPQGEDREHWLQAEAELRGRLRSA